MIVVWGSRLYGEVDQVSDLCWVATRFLHVYFVPLVPLGSVVVADQGACELPIDLSWKSILVTWARIACALLFLAGWGVVFSGLLAHRSPSGVTVGIGIGMLVAGVGGTLASRSKSRASYQRAIELCDHLGIGDEGRIQIALDYGQISEEEAHRRIEAGREQARRKAEASGAPATITLAEAAELKRQRRRQESERGPAG